METEEEIKKLKDEVRKLRSLIDYPPIFKKDDIVLIVDLFRNDHKLKDCLGKIKYSMSEGGIWKYDIDMDNKEMNYYVKEQESENLLLFDRLKSEICGGE